MSDTTIELCSHVCPRCGRCRDLCCPGHTREDQRAAWQQALADRAKTRRTQRGKPAYRVTASAGMIRLPRRTP
jgi:hypothetical protein